MIPDNKTNTIYFSEYLKTDKRFSKTYAEIEKALNSLGIKPKILQKTKDIWARDYMPIQIADDRFVEYRYDPNYLKDKTNYRTNSELVCKLINLKTIKSDLIIDGGNIVKSEDCIIITNKVFSENKHTYSKKELLSQLHKTFGVDKVVIIPWDEGEKYGHSDGILRFIDEDRVLISGIYKKDKELLESLEKAGIKYSFLELEKENKFNWAYINFLQTKDVILLPKFGTKEDEKVMEQFEDYYFEYSNGRIIQINMNEVAKNDGALNCISWTVKE